MMMGAGPVRGTAEMGPKPGGNSVRVSRAWGAGGEGAAHEDPCKGRYQASAPMPACISLQAQPHTAASTGHTLKGGCSGLTFG